jgi:hypothetical protein
MPTPSSFSFRIGEDTAIDVAVTPVQDISAWSLTFVAVRDGGPGAAAAAIKYTSAPGIQITDGPGGKVRVTIASASTSALAPGVYAWEVRRVDAGNNSVSAEGVFYLLPSTQRFS